jgi:hypothetical protein
LHDNRTDKFKIAKNDQTMKNTRLLYTTILFIAITNNSYSQDFETDRAGYQVMCVNDHAAKVTYISNVFYCREMSMEFDNEELVENKIGKELSSNTDGWSHFYEEEKEMVEKRDEFIAEGKQNNYEVVFFDVECVNGKVR